MFALFAAALAALSLLATVVDPIADPASAVQLAAQLWAGAQWAPLIALGVVAIVAAARRWGAELWPWLGTRVGGLVLVALTALAGSVLEALLAGGTLGVQVILNAIVAGVLAIGGHSAAKNALQGSAPHPIAERVTDVADLIRGRTELGRQEIVKLHDDLKRAVRKR